MRTLVLLLLALAVAACGGNSNTAPPPSPPPTPEVQELRRLVAEVGARPELDVEEMTVQHLLVGVRSKGGLENRAELSLPQAEQLAAELLAKARAGEDFRRLVLVHTYDHITSEAEPGVYILTRTLNTRPERGPNVFLRTQMVKGFAEVAWRLQPGEFGLAEYHRQDCPYGFHIIKRLK